LEGTARMALLPAAFFIAAPWLYFDWLL
jgi:hypothetical protein